MKTYKYGMKLRGFSPGAQPMKGLKMACEPSLERNSGKYYSILYYNHRLSQRDEKAFELDYLGEVE